ncbi:MAG: GNAT family N-acetyltransferase [Spirochaetaceae bacterium]|jgi:ribosomal protein S18 acetylase RimI-like enzyme|nr:GNAT family N-acetyltransferase [Spirochaetaceae bacterium]GMO27015.1 MAG: hypothetical protein Pg6A_14470 [Termitinemataceae bacterium]
MTKIQTKKASINKSGNLNSFDLYRWRKTHETEKTAGEIFLREHEKFCVSACARFKTLNFINDHAWILAANDLRAQAMLLHSRQTVFPVFNGDSQLKLPVHLYRALSNIKIHALHGLASDVDTLLKILLKLNYSSFETMEYYLMTLDLESELPCLRAPPKDLVLRRPRKNDIEKLLPLQTAYEREEVLPPGGILDPASSRFNIEKIVMHEEALIAEYKGAVAGKINTNDTAYSHCQIGGVYVMPEFRGQGIANSMTGTFIRLLRAKKFGITLYVRKTNKSALRAYRNAGFKIEADYKIIYM